jgi:hypothetical protein
MSVATAITLLFGAVATIAGLFATNYMRVLVSVTSSASVAEVAVPVGHWLLAAAWLIAVANLIGREQPGVAFRCAAVAFVLHVLILLTLFVDKLNDREAFSASVYLWYARLFCSAALAGTVVWASQWVRRLRAGASTAAAVESPICFGALALLLAMANQSPAMTITAVLFGMACAAVIALWPERVARVVDAARSFTQREAILLAAVFVVAFALRMLYVQRIMTDPNYLDTGADGRLYDRLAGALAGGGIPQSFTDRYPMLLLGYVWFLAAIYKVAGHSYLAAAAIQSVLGAASAVLVYVAGKDVFGAAAGRLAAMFTALNFSLIFAAAALGHQALDVFLTALIVVLLLRFVRDTTPAWRWTLVGLAMGAAMAVRETVVFFAAFVAAWIPWSYPRGWRAGRVAIVTYVAGASLVLAPFVAPKIWSPEGRQNIRAHFDRLYRGQAEAEPVRGDLVGPLADPGAAFSQLMSSPVHVVATLGRAYTKNVAVQFFTQPYGGFDLIFLRKGTEYYYGMWFYAYALALTGLAVALRAIITRQENAVGALLIIGLITTRTLPHIVLESDYRHRVPIEPFLILLAAVGAVSLATRPVTPEGQRASNSR